MDLPFLEKMREISHEPRLERTRVSKPWNETLREVESQRLCFLHFCDEKKNSQPRSSFRSFHFVSFLQFRN